MEQNKLAVKCMYSTSSDHIMDIQQEGYIVCLVLREEIDLGKQAIRSNRFLLTAIQNLNPESRPI